jgi:hypothetical protein
VVERTKKGSPMLTAKRLKILVTGKSGLTGFQFGPGVIGDRQVNARAHISMTHAETIAR